MPPRKPPPKPPDSGTRIDTAELGLVIEAMVDLLDVMADHPDVKAKVMWSTLVRARSRCLRLLELMGESPERER